MTHRWHSGGWLLTPDGILFAQPPAIGAMIWYSSALTSKGPSSSTCWPPTFFDTAQPRSRASSRMRSAAAICARAYSVSVVSHSTTW
jgi:hypothetical protein